MVDYIVILGPLTDNLAMNKFADELGNKGLIVIHPSTFNIYELTSDYRKLYVRRQKKIIKRASEVHVINHEWGDFDHLDKMVRYAEKRGIRTLYHTRDNL
jgi:hypothetical protein